MNEIVFQPYGKDEFYLNLFVQPNGHWVFGPSDVEDFKKINSKALVHSYLRVKGKNPKYYKVPIAEDFKLKEETADLQTIDDDKLPKHVEALYAFAIYNTKHEIVFFNYTYDEDEFNLLSSRFNIIATLVIIGDDLTIQEKNIETGFGVGREEVEDSIKILQDELKEGEE